MYQSSVANLKNLARELTRRGLTLKDHGLNTVGILKRFIGSIKMRSSMLSCVNHASQPS